MIEQKSIEHITAVVLRIAGVLTILIGLILTTHTILQMIAVHTAASGLPQGLPPGMSVNIKGAAGRVGFWAVVAQMMTMLWGGLLMAFAKPVAQRIAGP